MSCAIRCSLLSELNTLSTHCWRGEVILICAKDKTGERKRSTARNFFIIYIYTDVSVQIKKKREKGGLMEIVNLGNDELLAVESMAVGRWSMAVGRWPLVDGR
jgi:hypothetical protein